MKKIRKLTLFSCFLIMLIAFCAVGGISASAKDIYCIEASAEVSEKAYSYLNEIYIEKYPDLALEFPFGSEGDRRVLKYAADKITEGAKTDREKVDNIVKWVRGSIDYRSYKTGEGWVFAIDTYYNKKGNCLGTAQLILNFCRLSGIPAVMCCGPRGDMSKLLLEKKVPDHAWTMIYLEGEWYLYDPLFDVYGEKNKAFIDKWYFFDHVEGVSPYVEKYAKNIFTGDNIFYIDGRFVHYKNGVPASEYIGMNSAYCGASLNSSMPFFGRPHCEYSGWEYVEDNGKINSMIDNECYYDGWIKYGNSLSYAKPNGILTGARIMEHQGKTLYFSFMSGAVVLPGSPSDYTLTDGYLTLVKGEKVTVTPYWKQEEISSGNKIVWENVTPEIASVSKDGVITAISEGLGTFIVSSVDEYGSNSMSEIVQISVIPKKRTVSYSFSLDSCAFNGGHKYTNSCDADCNVCGEKRTVSHSYKTVTVKATLSKNGKTETVCSACGYIKSTVTLYSPKTVKLSATKYTYNGKVKTPSVTVKDSKGSTLKKGTDYTVTYQKGRKSAGKYTVTVTFKGKYSGTKKLSFTIAPKKATFSKVSAASKRFTASWKAVSSITGYQLQYSTSKKFSKKTTKTTKSRKLTVKKLKKGKRYYVRVRAYKTVNGQNIYGSWSSVKSVKVK